MIAPETLGLEDEFPFGARPIVRGYVSFREGTSHKLPYVSVSLSNFENKLDKYPSSSSQFFVVMGFSQTPPTEKKKKVHAT